MKVSEIIKNLEEFKEKHGDIECWYAEDDEDNGYQRVNFKPSLRYVDVKDGIVYNDEEDLEFCGVDIEDTIPMCLVN